MYYVDGFFLVGNLRRCLTRICGWPFAILDFLLIVNLHKNLNLE